MKISIQLYITFICLFYLQVNGQNQTLPHKEHHHQRDFTNLSQLVAGQTNPDYFTHHDHNKWTYFLNKAHPSVFKINDYFDQAAKEFGVPASLLKAIGIVESNWTQIGPSIDRGWGIMHLVQNEMINTLSEAALASGLTEEAIKEDPESNIRAAAALLAQYAGPDIVGISDVRKWFDAAQKFSGLSLEELRHSQARTYFEKIKTGTISQTLWGEHIDLKPLPKLVIPGPTINKSFSADYPPAISDITPCNFGTGRNHIIDTWVNHWIGVGTYAGAISWFHTCRPSAPSSAHFVIRSSDGEITQVVGVANTAYHAGASGQPYNNSRSIGVEHEATAANPALWNSVPMLNASTEMACYFAGIYNIPTTRSLPGIREHKEMPGTSTSCAGSIPWTIWMDQFTTCMNGGSSSGLDCGQAITINCGVTYSGMNSTEPSNVGSYGCNNWTESGPERIHKVTSTGYGILTATLSNFTGDLDVYILGSCDPDDCLGTVSSNQAVFTNAIAGQVYYIVVDADDGSGSSYDLIVNCPIGGSGPGLNCENTIPIQCGVTYNGASSSDASNVDSYACNNWTETGPERIHSITPNANGTLTASVSNYTGDLDVYILRSCDPTDCVGTVNSDSAVLADAVAGQTYYIVVDADDGSGSGYDLIVDCPQIGLSCFNAIPLTCGVMYNGPSSNNPSYVDDYACNNWTETGPERVHSFVAPADGTFTASVTNYSGDLDVYILNSCDPNDCIGTVGSDVATFTNAVAGQLYYIVVDADDGSNSSYSLIIDCMMTEPLCVNAISINCNETFIGSSSTAPSTVDTYACNNWTETGPERVHRIVPTGNGILLASIRNYSGDLDVYILDSCDPDDCIGTVTSENAVFNNAVAGKEYFIVVDSDDGSGSGYELYVECQSSGNISSDNCNTISHVTGSYEYDKTFQAEQSLTAEAIFSGSANILMCAGSTVELLNGFEIETGSEILVEIDDCSSN